jgi:hypothetical protein
MRLGRRSCGHGGLSEDEPAPECRGPEVVDGPRHNKPQSDTQIPANSDPLPSKAIATVPT